jgi:phosphoribosylformimino-5-aminoimidazole carboxamide ribotide isomerase
MIVYPAIDLLGGQVVRLLKGEAANRTVYSDDPVGVARRWREAGAAWLHVINLDGALGEAALNLDLLAQLAAVGLPIQFGGGIRSLDDVQAALDAGASRVIVGTLAVRQPEIVAEAVERFGAEALAAALDARDGKVATHGWGATSEQTPAALGARFAGMGLRHALYTDISRDGALTGVNVEATVELARATGLDVIASGGVSSLDDIRALKAAATPIAGVIVGKALYDEVFTLESALDVASR